MFQGFAGKYRTATVNRDKVRPTSCLVRRFPGLERVGADVEQHPEAMNYIETCLAGAFHA